MYYADNNNTSHAPSYVVPGRGKNVYGMITQRLATQPHRQSFVYPSQQKQQIHNQGQTHHRHNNHNQSQQQLQQQQLQQQQLQQQQLQQQQLQQQQLQQQQLQQQQLQQQHYRHHNQLHQAQFVDPSQFSSNVPFVQAPNASLKQNFVNEYVLHAGYQRFNHNTRPRHQKTPVTYDDERYQKQLIVNYLAPNVSSEELHKLFSCFGPLDGARIIYDRQTRLTKGYGFVYFCYPESARMAVEQMNGFEFYGKRLKVGYSTNPLNIVSNVTPQYPPGATT